MRSLVRSLSIVACVVGLSGAAAWAEQVDSPVFKSWAKYKPGTTVTYLKVDEDEAPNRVDRFETTITTKLLEVRPDAVVVETTQVAGPGGWIAHPVSRVEVPAKMEKPKEEKEGVAPGGNVRKSDVKDGKEKVDVCGKSVDTTTHEETLVGTHQFLMDDGRPGGPVPVTLNQHWKSWMSDDVPGGSVKYLSVSPKYTTTTMVVSVKIVK